MGVMAAEFSTFSFETNFSYNPNLDPETSFNTTLTVEQLKPFSDIRLDSVTFGGKTMHGFLFVTGANIILNQFDNLTGTDASGFVRKPWWVINTGRGHNTPYDPYVNEGPTSGENGATNADLVAAYGNRNLNSINYNRERGPIPSDSVFEISFPYDTDTFFIWERGMDSDMRIQAIDGSGNPIADAYILRPSKDTNDPKLIQYAGYGIYTDTGFNWALGNPQRCGSVGLRLNGATAKTLRFTVNHNADFGPDLKVVAAPLPGPSTMILLKEAVELIDALEDGCFSNNNLRDTLITKIEVAIGMIAQGNYHGAVQKLQNDVLPKVSGYGKASSRKNAWVMCPGENDANEKYLKTVEELIVEVIGYLKFM